MSARGITKVKIDLTAPSNTDWTAFDAMTEEDVETAARSDPDAQPMTPEQLARLRRRPDVTKIRTALSLTQDEFAKRFGLPRQTVRDWEKDGVPVFDKVAWVLLALIEAEPDMVARVGHGKTVAPQPPKKRPRRAQSATNV